MESLYFQALQLTPHRHGVLGRGTVSTGGVGGPDGPLPYLSQSWPVLALHNRACPFVPGEWSGSELLSSRPLLELGREGWTTGRFQLRAGLSPGPGTDPEIS